MADNPHHISRLLALATVSLSLGAAAQDAQPEDKPEQPAENAAPLPSLDELLGLKEESSDADETTSNEDTPFDHGRNWQSFPTEHREHLFRERSTTRSFDRAQRDAAKLLRRRIIARPRVRIQRLNAGEECCRRS
ncbi:MAG: hypothetical protein AAGA22_07030 [Pseudomonadota bacterium]